VLKHRRELWLPGQGLEGNPKIEAKGDYLQQNAINKPRNITSGIRTIVNNTVLCIENFTRK
jgi:hypothetical protein